MTFTDEQKKVIRDILKGLSDGQNVITFGGIGGSGKSTICSFILNALNKKGLKFHPCAFTGKAANVMRKKGMKNATTIHSSIYSPIVDLETKEVTWTMKSCYEVTDQIDGFLVDEASMVSKEIHEDLMSYNLPIIYVGDHGQLEPIGTSFNLMKDPMYKLETVHRNAGEISHFANHLRKGESAPSSKWEKQVQIVYPQAIKDEHYSKVDQVICAFNKTRCDINEKVRSYKQIDLSYISKNEKIICLRNNKRLGLFNGMQGVVTKIKPKNRFDFISDGYLHEDIRYDPDQFGKMKNDFEFRQEENPFDYAYAITAHKSQGDEFGSVIGYEERCDKWDHIRWSYTVASRAKRSLIWVASNKYY
jgi:exodeoxyribonuclease-5